MAQTHYIEVDEEIISAVGRLRRLPDAEHVLVFPKRALILQSVVNLKLLEREARKMGKRITVVTQDREGRLLAEKAGLATQAFDAEMERGANAQTATFTVSHQPAPGAVSNRPPQARRIGSNDFFAGRTKIQQPQSPLPKPEPVPPRPTAPTLPPRPLRIRNASPPQLTSLNSLRQEVSPQRSEMRPQLPPVTPPSPVQRPEAVLPPRSPISPPLAEHFPDQERRRKLDRFLSGERRDSNPPSETSEIQSQAAREHGTPSRRSANIAFALLALICLTVGAGAIVVLFFPKAIVSLEPQGSEETVRLALAGTTAAPRSDALPPEVSARLVTEEKDIVVTIEATGALGSVAEKARGKVVIYNRFSSQAQPLVATTRLKAKDGQIFRLIESVTVPGMTRVGGKDEPGAIEAQVIADSAGSEYNIGPSDFTIPGFQGSPKFEKFTATSAQAFSGGGSGNGGGGQSVSRQDLDTALESAKREAKKELLERAQHELGSSETVLEESATTELVGDASAPQIGTSGKTFEYRGRFSGRVFVLSTAGVEAAVRATLAERPSENGVALRPAAVQLSYTDVMPDFERNRVEFTVMAKVVLRATLDEALLRTELAGQDEAGIRTVLERHPEIKRLQVQFTPRYFVSTIPKKSERIDIVTVDTDTVNAPAS